ncbi:MAG: glycosyltransferase [Bacteroidota bacterium]
MRDAFCFITCVADEEMYAHCLEHIQALDLPPGYEIETRKIVGATSMAAAYDDMMRSSAARYKVYLHDNALILDRHLLYHLLDIFRNPKVEMIGITGGTRIPKSGVWYHDALHSFGYFMRYGRLQGFPYNLLPLAWNKEKIRRSTTCRSFGSSFLQSALMECSWPPSTYGADTMMLWRQALRRLHAVNCPQERRLTARGQSLSIRRERRPG